MDSNSNQNNGVFLLVATNPVRRKSYLQVDLREAPKSRIHPLPALLSQNIPDVPKRNRSLHEPDAAWRLYPSQVQNLGQILGDQPRKELLQGHPHSLGSNPAIP